MILVFKDNGGDVLRVESSKPPSVGDLVRLSPGGKEFQVQKIVTEYSRKLDYHVVEITVR